MEERIGDDRHWWNISNSKDHSLEMQVAPSRHYVRFYVSSTHLTDKSPKSFQSGLFRSTHAKYPIVNAINGTVRATNNQDCVAKTKWVLSFGVPADRIWMRLELKIVCESFQQLRQGYPCKKTCLTPMNVAGKYRVPRIDKVFNDLASFRFCVANLVIVLLSSLVWNAMSLKVSISLCNATRSRVKLSLLRKSRILKSCSWSNC